jgi:hypothetical protein
MMINVCESGKATNYQTRFRNTIRNTFDTYPAFRSNSFDSPLTTVSITNT